MNSSWSKLYRDATEKSDRVHVDETRNTVVPIKGVHSFIIANQKIIVLEWNKLRFRNNCEFYGFNRKFAYAVKWEESYERDLFEKQTLDRIEEERLNWIVKEKERRDWLKKHTLDRIEEERLHRILKEKERRELLEKKMDRIEKELGSTLDGKY